MLVSNVNFGDYPRDLQCCKSRGYVIKLKHISVIICGYNRIIFVLLYFVISILLNQFLWEEERWGKYKSWSGVPTKLNTTQLRGRVSFTNGCIVTDYCGGGRG